MSMAVIRTLIRKTSYLNDGMSGERSVENFVEVVFEWFKVTVVFLDSLFLLEAISSKARFSVSAIKSRYGIVAFKNEPKHRLWLPDVWFANRLFVCGNYIWQLRGY